jgi:uncharacterized lipoprotein NlpE involved in copper resistance
MGKGDSLTAIRLDALQLMGCGNKEKGLINGVGRFMRGTAVEHNVCIGNLHAAEGKSVQSTEGKVVLIWSKTVLETWATLRKDLEQIWIQ